MAARESRGEVLGLETVWALSRAWYGDRMSPHFRGRTGEEAVGVFAGVGLTSPFWQAGNAGD